MRLSTKSIIQFEVDLKIPANKSYTSLKIEDLLPAGLKVADPASDIKIVTTITPLGLTYNTDYTVTPVEDPTNKTQDITI